jgi:NAD+--asparagine ADP-ribosyltransferase
MIKTHIEEKQELVKHTIRDSIICNKCGREFTDNLLGWKHNKEIMDIFEALTNLKMTIETDVIDLVNTEINKYNYPINN